MKKKLLSKQNWNQENIQRKNKILLKHSKDVIQVLEKKSLMKNVIKLEQIFRRDNQPSKDSNFSGSQKYNDWQVCSILWILNLERQNR